MTTYTFKSSDLSSDDGKIVVNIPNEIRRYLKRVRVVNKEPTQPVTVVFKCNYQSLNNMLQTKNKEKVIYVSFCPAKSIDENKEDLNHEIFGNLIVKSDVNSDNIFVILEIGD